MMDPDKKLYGVYDVTDGCDRPVWVDTTPDAALRTLESYERSARALGLSKEFEVRSGPTADMEAALEKHRALRTGARTVVFSNPTGHTDYARWLWRGHCYKSGFPAWPVRYRQAPRPDDRVVAVAVDAVKEGEPVTIVYGDLHVAGRIPPDEEYPCLQETRWTSRQIMDRAVKHLARDDSVLGMTPGHPKTLDPDHTPSMPDGWPWDWH